MSNHVGLPIIFLKKTIDLVRDKNQKEFDVSLFKHVRIKVIDIIDFDQNLSTKEKEGLWEEREGYWQHRLPPVMTEFRMTEFRMTEFRKKNIFGIPQLGIPNLGDRL